MKGSINKILKRINKFIKNNKLFVSFVIVCVLISFLLRILTIGFYIDLKAILADILVSLFIGSFAYFIKVDKRYVYYLLWIIFFSILSIADLIYYEFYHSFISISLLATTSMVGKVNDSLFAKLKIHQFVFLIFPIIFILIKKRLIKKDYFSKLEEFNKKNLFKKMYLIILIILVILTFSFTQNDKSKFSNFRNKEYVVKNYGLYVYTFHDLIKNETSYDEAAMKFREYYSCKKESSDNEYTNIFKGKNVLFIHAESIQNFLIDLKINNHEVTPNINKLAHEGMYFSKFYPQISVGTSSDSEFTLTTGLMPSTNGTVFVNYDKNTYKAMPNYFNDLGYYTFSMHANDRTYWNRESMYKRLGYQKFYAKESFIVPEDINSENYIGLGLSDKSFFKQIIPILSDIKKNNTPYFGTIITLSNHSPYKESQKFGDFDLSMSYKYTDEEGNTIVGRRKYLEDTEMGYYIKSAHYADEAIGDLFNDLKENNLLDNTIIVFYGDHEARLPKKEFERLYNYDPINDSLLSEDDENYYSMDNYNYDLLRNTPLIIWSNDEKYSKEITKVMGMYDVLPTIANMFGFKEKFSLGQDIFSSEEGIVVFPNGNVLTDNVYYSDLYEEYITFNSNPISSDYINNLKEYANNILEVSNEIVEHDLIKTESDKLGECIK